MRVFLYIRYDGSKFQGFQEQPNKKSVMDSIVFALRELGITSKPIGSGRTDSGVHALNQVVHIDIPPFWEESAKLKSTLNSLLSPAIYVKKIVEVNDDAHARFDAKKRFYRYICYTGEYSPFLSDFAVFTSEIDLELANKSLSLFEGSHDFGFFKKTGSPTTHDRRTIFKADVYRYKNFFVFRFVGDGFLRSQVRMMVAAVLAVQKGSLSLEDLRGRIEKQKRGKNSVAKAAGLYLSRVYY